MDGTRNADEQMTKATIATALAAMVSGEFVLVVDEAGQGQLIIAAEKATTETVAFMVRHTNGLICVPMTGERLDQLGISLTGSGSAATDHGALTDSLDAADRTTTGSTAKDRAATIRTLVDPATRPQDLVRPGHIFPVRYRPGGVLTSSVPAQAAVDLARLAALEPAAALSEVVRDDGSTAQFGELETFAAKHGIPMITIADLIEHRWQSETLVVREVETTLPTAHGVFNAFGYRSTVDDSEHVALVFGDVAGKADVLTRMHSRCLTGDVLGSRRCDCGPQLEASMAKVTKAGAGIITYNEAHEGRGIGLLAKLNAYRLQDEGKDTVDANLEQGFPIDARHYGIEAQILRDLGVSSVQLLTNNPLKIEALQSLGIEVGGRVSLVAGLNGDNEAYMATKVNRLGHMVGHVDGQ